LFDQPKNQGGYSMNHSFFSRRVLAILSASVLLSPVVVAQESERVERLEVTGSHIRRIDVEGPSPIQVIDREALDNTGYNSVSDVLRDITASAFGGAREASGSTAAGVATVNLRGLGASRTLVLLDGKRLPADPVAAAVDLNLIPMAAVERIDILKDGASATYGSDALGGVVNIITRKDFNGTEISARTSVNKDDGGERTDISLINGTATNRARVISVLNYRNNKRIYSRDRKWSNDGWSIFAEPANYQVDMDDGNGFSAITRPTACGANHPDVALCGYKFSDFSDEVPSIEQMSIMSQFSYDINPDLTFYARLMATRSKIEWQYAPAASFYELTAENTPDFNDIATFIGAGGAKAIRVRDRLTDLGPRTSEILANAYGVQTGLRGYVFDTWQWDASYDYNHNIRTDISKNGYLLSSALTRVIGTGANKYNPFAAAGTRDPNGVLKSGGILYQPWDQAQSTNHFVEAKASGELFYLNGRPLAMALGSTYLYDAYQVESDIFSVNGDVLGSAGGTGTANRNAVSAFTEFAYNPVESLEVQLAGRFDHYNDFGSTVNPKLGLRWQASNQLMMRASAGTGFKAPTLQQLYGAQSVGNPTFKDEVACDFARKNNPSQASFYCNAQQYEVKSGGNPNLQEEKSVSYNVGAMYQFARRTSFGFDFWGVDLEEAVGVSLQKITEAELKGLDVASRGIEIQRDAQNRIISMTALNSNLASSKLMGIDLAFSHGQETPLGDISIRMDHSHLFKYTNEFFPGLGEESVFELGGAPKWRNNITLGYVPVFHTSSSIYLIAKTIASNFKSDPSAGKLSRYTEVDFQYNLALPWSATFTVGIINLLGSTPPLDDTLPGSKLDDTLYNPFGQAAYVQYTQSF
jgi:iron complex outermembrane recepter protein